MEEVMGIHRCGKSKRLPGKYCFMFDIMVNGARHRQRTTCGRDEVDELYAAWRKQFRVGNDPEQRGRPLLFFQMFEKYLDELAKLKSLKQYKAEERLFENRLNRFFSKDTLLRDVRRRNIIEYLTWRKRQLSYQGKVTPSSINKELSVLSKFFRWLIELEILEQNPCKGLKESEQGSIRIIHLTPGEVKEIIEKSKAYGELHTAVMLAIHAGLRRTEALTLTWHDIDFQNQRINLRAAITKTKRHRSVPVNDILFAFLNKRKREGELVVGLGNDGLRSRFRKLRNELSFVSRLPVRELHFHDLRHVFGQTLLDSKVPMADISAFMGHRSVVITQQRYCQSGGYNGVAMVNQVLGFFNVTGEQLGGKNDRSLQ